MSNQFKFADSVWHRVVNIVQEAMMTGVDCADLLRQVCVVTDADDPNMLVLSPEYQKSVREMHEKMLKHAHELQSQQVGNKFIITDGNTKN